MNNSQNKPLVNIFCDGACKGNPGPGGWGAILLFGKTRKEIYGYSKKTTNNIMELTAAIRALGTLKQTCHVQITTDSQYMKNGIQSWIHNWKRNAWRTSKKRSVKNRELWQELDSLVNKHEVEWYWVRGHTGHPENERADALANEAILTCADEKL